MRCQSLAAIVLIALSAAGQVRADLVTSRADLAGTDFVDWEVLGPRTDVPDVANPSAFTSNGGVAGLVSQTANNVFGRRDQDDGLTIVGSWTGNFDPGDHLLWTFLDQTGPNSNIMSLDFGPGGITSGGAQIQSSYSGAEFVARISAYDTNGLLLGSYTRTAFSDENLDNSAIFIGVANLGRIGRIEFSLESAPGGNTGGFAINRFDFSPTAVPEPASLLLMTLGLGGMGLIAANHSRGGKTGI